MSVVAAMVRENGVEIASDSITVRGYTQRKNGAKFSKLFTTDSGLVVGGVGLAEENSMMLLFLATYRLADAAAGAVLELLRSFSVWKKAATEDGKITNDFLICYRGRLFSTNGWHVAEVATFDAVGAGADYALAALHLGNSPRRAVEVAIELSVFCEGPVIEIFQERVAE